MLRLPTTVGLWMVTRMMVHVLESWKDLNNKSHNLEPMRNKAKAVNLFGCALQHLGMDPCPTHELIQSLAVLLATALLPIFSHTVGRVWGACWGAVLTSAVLGTGVAPSLSGQRILMSGCMTARRCAKVLAGGFQASPGWHVVRGGQSLQMAWLVPSVKVAPSCIVNYGSCGLVLAVFCLLPHCATNIFRLFVAMCLSNANSKMITTRFLGVFGGI